MARTSCRIVEEEHGRRLLGLGRRAAADAAQAGPAAVGPRARPRAVPAARAPVVLCSAPYRARGARASGHLVRGARPAGRTCGDVCGGKSRQPTAPLPRPHAPSPPRPRTRAAGRGSEPRRSGAKWESPGAHACRATCGPGPAAKGHPLPISPCAAASALDTRCSTPRAARRARSPEPQCAVCRATGCAIRFRPRRRSST